MPTNPGYDPTRRNRNIGTEKQGHGQNNKLVIPWPAAVMKAFYERLGNYRKVIETIDGKEYTFVVEETRENSVHACSVSDLVRILEHVPSEDLDGLDLIVFRQPKRKEQILSPVWGRLIYSYEFEKADKPAVILESADLKRRLKWSKHLCVDSQREFERLIADGHAFKDTGRYFETDYRVEAVRNTQLYRTLLHEIGHYVHYLKIVERPGSEDEDFETWKTRSDQYGTLSTDEKERFAHRYADTLRQRLTESGVIPFEHLVDE